MGKGLQGSRLSSGSSKGEGWERGDGKFTPPIPLFSDSLAMTSKLLNPQSFLSETQLASAADSLASTLFSATSWSHLLMVSLALEWDCLDPVRECSPLADPAYADSQGASVPLPLLPIPDACSGHSPTWHLTLTTSTWELRPSLPRWAPSASQEVVPHLCGGSSPRVPSLFPSLYPLPA